MLHGLYLHVEPKSESFLRKYLKAKHDLGSEELKLLKILFFGPPGAGKTTLLSVLLGKDIQSPRESTGVLDRKLVQFKVAVQKNVEREISQWKIVSINDEISRLRRTIEKILEKRASEHDNDDLKSDLKIDDKLAKDIVPDSENDDQTDQQQYIASNTLMACYDSGGQPEFFDVMPAFISATTGNIMIFDMSKDLNSPLDPEFYKNGQLQKLSDVKTHYTGTELLKTALANIQSHTAKYSSSTQVSFLGSNRLLVVGTHLDQCGRTEDEVKGRLKLMEKIICKDVLHSCSTISVMTRSRGKNTTNVYPIASKCDVSNDEAVKNREVVAQEIRTAIENMSESEDVAKEVPISWLLFQYELKLHSTPCILRSDCDQIADKCYIPRKDVDDILLFFHELGILLYYKDKSGKLSQVVFSEPQWLFAQLTTVIQLKYDPSYETEGSIKKGIFKKQFLKELYGKEFDSNLKGISLYDYIIDLFVHLNIMAGLSDVTEKYFMPALLNPVPNVNSIDELFGDEVCSTLCVKFKDGFFPRGMFCCLIALCVKRNRYWKLQPDSAYKDLVVFQIDGNEEYLILSDKIHYISVEIHRKEVLQQNKHQVLFCVLYDNLKEVCNTIHLDGEFTFGFLCKKERCKQFASVQHPYSPEKLLCSVCDYNPTMTYDQLVWFISHKVLDICNKVSTHLYNHKQVQIVLITYCIAGNFRKEKFLKILRKKMIFKNRLQNILCSCILD